MRGRTRPTPLTPEQRAEMGLPAESFALPPTADPPVPLADIPDRDVPDTRDKLAFVLAKGIARALELARDAKGVTDALKAGTDLFKVLYPGEGTDDLGSALPHGGRNGHAG
jgi:hypothetical protein